MAAVNVGAGRARHGLYGFGADVRYGPIEIGGRRVLLRRPRFSDYASWSAARHAAEAHIVAAFGDVGSGEIPVLNNSRRAWVERCLRLRRGARHGTAAPFVVVDLEGGTESVLGEFGIDGVDDWTWVGEASAWLSPIRKSSEIAVWATAAMMLEGFSQVRPYPRIIGPVAVGNSSAARLSAAVGMTVVARARALRMYDGRPTDHDVWALDNTPDTRARLRGLIDRYELTAPIR